MKRPQTGDVVEVEWLDSEHIALGWAASGRYRDAAAAPQSYRTAGYYIGGVAGHVLVALSCDPSNSTITHCMSIPKVAVTGMKVLGRAAKRTRKALG